MVEVKVNVEFHGDPEEVGLLLAQLAGTLMGEGDAEEEDETDPSWWTPERATAFVKELTNPALLALAIIAQHAPKASFRDVQRQMLISGIPLGPGRLSSIGFAVRRLRYPAAPFLRDYYQRAYVIDESVAKVLREAIAAEEARRGQK